MYWFGEVNLYSLELTENTVSGDTVLYLLIGFKAWRAQCQTGCNPVPVQRYCQPPSISHKRTADHQQWAIHAWT